MTWRDWRRLGPATTGPAVLAIDFGPGRAAAGFAELAPRLGGGLMLLEPPFTAPAPEAAGHGAPGPMVRAWAAEAARHPEGVAGVLGFCSGSALACALAEALEESGLPRPALILFDPEFADAPLLRHYFEAAIRSFEGVLDTAELTEALARGRHAAAPDRYAGMPPLAVELTGIYREMAMKACISAGMDDEFGQQLTERLGAFLGYLATTGEVDAGVPRRATERDEAEVLISAEHTPPPDYGTGTRAFDVARTHLLDDQDVADAVMELLAKETAR
ncbi:hypothetical protein ACFV97_14030 [Streptomyces sp. NPDC059913]|uniref:hypothetical protein n=1 Tax=unclassified Streptomyces TaxID=2593676 RepID=UPI0036499D35